MLVQIENRREYELHVNKVVASKGANIPNKTKDLIKELVMDAFDDAIKMTQSSLFVEVSDTNG
ncbi:MAG: hypothetical protein JHC33_09055 [Ignisphaera sp.]|nr:hypothetical protein [Ignisphaera sp.]